VTLRIGILGAARIAPNAVIKPARDNAEVAVTAVAARDEDKARRYAAKHGIPTVHGSYDELLADPDVDAVYNPLPNGLHGRWTIAALEAGKHVLCEKPFTANAEEAEAVAAVAAAHPDRVVMEAFHWRYHPMTERALEIIGSGELGEVRHIATWMCVPLLKPSDIRWQLGLAGGSVMDVGCYAIHQLRTYAGAEPEVISARAKLWKPGVDRWLGAELRFADGRTGSIRAAMASTRVLALGARIVGTKGELRVRNPTLPSLFGRLKWPGHSEGPGSRRMTYAFQLDAFAGAVNRGEPIPTGVEDSVATMRVIDACYRAAGLQPREPS
jgi:predicted dehydrogenase